MELLHRYRGFKQPMIAERFGGLDEGLVIRDRKAIREDPKVVSGSHEAKKLSQGLTLPTLKGDPRI